jgi:hypothetical protein
MFDLDSLVYEASVRNNLILDNPKSKDDNINSSKTLKRELNLDLCRVKSKSE